MNASDDAALELRSVSKRYVMGDEAVRAVDRLSLTVSGGELVALYGPSGSGKTTTLLLAAATLDPDEGSVVFRGRDLAGLSDVEGASYRRKIGFIFQSFHLMEGSTALDNTTVKLACDGLGVGEARRKAWSWLARVGLSSRALFTPDQLSMGERQRVVIARALVNEPQLILADEPTANLDSQWTRTVFQLLGDVCREHGIPGLLVTHDPVALDLADRACAIRDGRIEDLAGSDQLHVGSPSGTLC